MKTACTTRSALSFTRIALALFALVALSPATQAQTYRFAVVMSGNTSFGQPFVRTGVVVLTRTVTRVTTNGVNPVDVALASGNPAITPEVGAINFGTNSAFLGGRAAIDLAYVNTAVRGNTLTVTVQPDPRIAATYANFFTVNSGLTAFPYNVNTGTMVLTFTTDARGQLTSVTGRVDIADALKGTRYQATLTGRRQ